MEELKKIGLTDYESKIYLSLIVNGKSDASLISQKSQVPITAVYPNLKGLIKKGLIQRIDSENSYFEAINPKIALNTLIEKQHSLLKETKDDLLEKIRTLPNKTKEGNKDIVSLSQGVEASTEVTKEFISTVRKSFYIIGWRFRSSHRINQFLRDMNYMRKRHIDVKVILTLKNKQTKELAEECKKYKIPLKYYPIENFSIIIKDKEECKITLKGLDLPERINLHIKDDDLTQALTDYFLIVWKKAKEI